MGKYVVIDLEMCTVPRVNKSQYGYKSEIIQIGAAALDEDYNVIDKFNSYVHPQYGQISKFISELTGIKPKDVQNAELLLPVMEKFLAWIPEGDVTMVSWSTTDKYQLIHELDKKGIVLDRMNALYENWYDCQPLFSEKMKMKKSYSLEEALIATDIVTEGRAHDGLTDAYNAALLYAKMMKEPVLTLNPYYKSAHDDGDPEGLRYSLADLLDNIKLED